MIPINRITSDRFSESGSPHYNRAHTASLGLAFPSIQRREPASASDVYLIPDGCSVVAKPILAGSATSTVSNGSGLNGAVKCIADDTS